MVRPAQTARSERTREALRQAAVVRFLAQGVEDTSAEQIAADAGVSLRTFYRHFASKHDLLFADYDAGLHWFRSALAKRSPDESIIESVQSAILARPYDDWAVAEIAALRAQELDPGRIVRHIRQVETDFAEAIEEHLGGDDPPKPGTDDRMRDHRHRAVHRGRGVRRDGGLDAGGGPLATRVDAADPRGVADLAEGNRRGRLDRCFVIIDKTLPPCQPQPMADFDAIVVGAGHNGLTAAALLQQGRAAHAVPGLQALRRRNGLHRGAFRRLQVRDRRLGADSDVGRRSAASSASTRCPRSTST